MKEHIRCKTCTEAGVDIFQVPSLSRTWWQWMFLDGKFQLSVSWILRALSRGKTIGGNSLTDHSRKVKKSTSAVNALEVTQGLILTSDNVQNLLSISWWGDAAFYTPYISYKLLHSRHDSLGNEARYKHLRMNGWRYQMEVFCHFLSFERLLDTDGEEALSVGAQKCHYSLYTFTFLVYLNRHTTITQAHKTKLFSWITGLFNLQLLCYMLLLLLLWISHFFKKKKRNSAVLRSDTRHSFYALLWNVILFNWWQRTHIRLCALVWREVINHWLCLNIILSITASSVWGSNKYFTVQQTWFPPKIRWRIKNNKLFVLFFCVFISIIIYYIVIISIRCLKDLHMHGGWSQKLSCLRLYWPHLLILQHVEEIDWQQGLIMCPSIHHFNFSIHLFYLL